MQGAESNVEKHECHSRPQNKAATDPSRTRAEKLAAIKEAIAAGAYKIHTEDIVYNVLREFPEIML